MTRTQEAVMKSPTDTLRAEHEVILRALDVLTAAAARQASGVPVPEAFWPEIVHWLRSFADVNHHAKEETSLFPAMQKAGVPSEGGPIGVMLAEHTQGRRLIQAMATGEGDARATAARQYAELLRSHIDKENNVLFMIADGVLDDQVMAELRRQFDAVEAEQGVPATIPHAEAALAKLAGY
jgi:hemerythrin-like domain-containing protein